MVSAPKAEAPELPLPLADAEGDVNGSVPGLDPDSVCISSDNGSVVVPALLAPAMPVCSESCK